MPCSGSQQPGQSIVCWEDAHYPRLLRELASPPLVLYIKGDLASLSALQVAVVGSRRATSLGLQQAECFATDLVRAGVAITSGLAYGIDAASHQAALKAAGKTIAVMGCGLNRIYPKCHTTLASAIVEQGGALVSEFSPDVPPKPRHFPQRNRIISGLACGVLIVEAAVKSGSLITARYALEQGREVFAVPGSIQNPRTKGCHALIRHGAKLVESVEDIFEELTPIYPDICKNTAHTVISSAKPLAPEQAKLVECVDFEPTSVDLIAARSGLTTQQVCSQLAFVGVAGGGRSCFRGLYEKDARKNMKNNDRNGCTDALAK